MSFSSLPTELVRQIIESSVPSTFQITSYADRQSSLTTLCLVSHRFYEVARSILREVVKISKKAKMESVMELARVAGWGLSVRELVLWIRPSSFSSYSYRLLALAFPNVTALSFDDEIANFDPPIHHFDASRKLYAFIGHR